MQDSEAHYRTHLGPVYAWMLGDLEAAFARGAAEIAALPIPSYGIAVDLGAGLGLHALPLAQRGLKVVALDNCKVLLDELRSKAVDLPIRVHDADLLQFPSLVKDAVQVIVCMGDTLTHLPSQASVEALLSHAAGSLVRGGVFAATFRDYATRALQGDQRFILVRAGEDRILTCFLEYGETQVIVHDVLTEKERGQWHQKVSSYPKLRLEPEWVAARLAEKGCSVKRDVTPSGMVRIVATKA
ncbi:MAG TPA: class I SAM-dependent methyltransferase [Steroidobacteraceae bacterium]|jgi:SAM-dependent methyltransferase|nr:class I SAM-dependent methyltransferase [Steroidobacteraceae bacterium]